jgi:serine/threonine protein kinase
MNDLCADHFSSINDKIFFHRSTKRTSVYVVKKYARSHAAFKSNRILQEKAVMQILSTSNESTSPYIVGFVDTSKDSLFLYIIMESCLGGPLHKHIKSSAGGKLHVDIAIKYCAEIVSAIIFMGKLGCVHRDIKASNIVLSSYGHLKLCDFGSAKQLFERTSYSVVVDRGSPCDSPKVVSGRRQKAIEMAVIP